MPTTWPATKRSSHTDKCPFFGTHLPRAFLSDLRGLFEKNLRRSLEYRCSKGVFLIPPPTRAAAEAATPPANNPPLACLLGPDLRAAALLPWLATSTLVLPHIEHRLPPLGHSSKSR
jgi:hypothetical protein